MSEIDPEDFEAQLDEIIVGFGGVSPEAQQGALFDVLSIFEQEWEDTGVAATLRNATPLEDIDHITLHRVYYYDDPRGVVEEHYFHMTGTATINDVSRRVFAKIPVSHTVGGIRYPMAGFTRYDAGVIAEQVTKLDDLKSDGLLPNLAENLGCIVVQETGIVLPPKK